MAGETTGLSLGDLISRLHSAILDFVNTIDETLRQNGELGMSDIRSLRDHIRVRLQKNEDIEDNKKLLKVLDLFATNKAVMELVREDAEEWLMFLDDIEKGLSQKAQSGALTKDELEDMERMRSLTREIRELIRK